MQNGRAVVLVKNTLTFNPKGVGSNGIQTTAKFKHV